MTDSQQPQRDLAQHLTALYEASLGSEPSATHLWGQIVDTVHASSPQPHHEGHISVTPTHDTSPVVPVRRAPARTRPWQALTAVAAVLGLIVMTVFVFHTLSQRGPAGSTSTGAPTSTMPPAACNAAQIAATLPPQSTIADMTMVSPTAGWAVGKVGDDQHSDILVMQYSHCRWTHFPVPSIPQGSLTSIAMDAPNDGWAIGTAYPDTGPAVMPIVLHYHANQWQYITLPASVATDGFTKIALISATEGWILGGHKVHGTPYQSLLHYVNGTWTWVDTPFPFITDISPIGPADLWVAGLTASTGADGVLGHYQAGHWTTEALPKGTQIDQLRMPTTAAGWAMGQTFPGDNTSNRSTAVLYHYDGHNWQAAYHGIAAAYEHYVMTTATEGWSFAFQTYPPFPPSYQGPALSSAQFYQAGQWHAVPWSITQVYEVVGISRVAADDYWMVGHSTLYTKDPTPSGDPGATTYRGTDHSVFLHFVNGSWSEYGA